MSVKMIIFFCVHALLAHAISAQLFGGGVLSRGLAGGFNPAVFAGSGVGLASNALGFGAPLNAPANNGFTVTSSSPIVPSGVSVVTEYVIEGPVKVGGKVISRPRF